MHLPAIILTLEVINIIIPFKLKEVGLGSHRPSSGRASPPLLGPATCTSALNTRSPLPQGMEPAATACLGAGHWGSLTRRLRGTEGQS